MDVNIRPAEDDDEAAVVALWRAAGLTVPDNDPVADFRFARQGSASGVLVADDAASCLVGVVMVGHDGHRGWLYYLACAPDRRRHGIGRCLTQAAEDWLRRRGVAKVQLMVRHANARVTPFYERLGYEETPRIVMAKWIRADSA